eukprot:m.4780 g.4780  ORF g.4780 m.4780 type:complete len:494 (+) comp3987_c0_seq1:107-1588(+)
MSEEGSKLKLHTPSESEMTFLRDLDDARRDGNGSLDVLLQKHGLLLREYNNFIAKHTLVLAELEKVTDEKEDAEFKLQSVEKKRAQLEALCRCLQSKNKQLRSQTKDTKPLELSDEALENGMFPQFKARVDTLKEGIAQSKFKDKRLHEEIQLFIEQSQLREEQVVKLLDAKSLEVKIYAAKLEAKEEKLRDLMGDHDFLVKKYEDLEETVKSMQEKMKEAAQAYAHKDECYKEALKKEEVRFNSQVSQTLEWVMRYNTLGQTLAKTTEENIVYRNKMEEKDNQIATMADMLRKLQRERITMREKLPKGLQSTNATQSSSSNKRAQTTATSSTNATTVPPTSVMSSSISTPSNNLERYSHGPRVAASLSSDMKRSSSTPSFSLQKGVDVQEKEALVQGVSRDSGDSEKGSGNKQQQQHVPKVSDKEVEDMLEKAEHEFLWIRDKQGQSSSNNGNNIVNSNKSSNNAPSSSSSSQQTHQHKSNKKKKKKKGKRK